MAKSGLDSRIVRMPEFVQGTWLNTAEPLTKERLRGQVVLVDFWDYACVNCIRTLPYLREWHSRYAEKGLVIVGIHTPEFKFGQWRTQLETAVAEHQILYPVLLDNEAKNWAQYANRAWPTKYVMDTSGYIRLTRQGEGHYQEVELALQTLLRERDSTLSLPPLLPLLRPEDKPGAVCYPTTPELYAGYQGGGLFGGALGNPEGYAPHNNPSFYRLPEELEEGQFYLDGVWRAWPEALAYAGQDGGRVVVPYRAVSVNAVLSPSADPVELMLDLRPSADEPVVEIRQDGRSLTPANAGADIEWQADGKSVVRVKRARMVELVKNITSESHRLELIFHATGVAFYTFTFTSCVAS